MHIISSLSATTFLLAIVPCVSSVQFHVCECKCVCICMCTGTADVVSVGCVYIGESSSQEVEQFTSSDGSCQPNQRVDPVMSSIGYELHTEQLKECNVDFEAVNPHTPSYKTIVIRNYRSAAVLDTCIYVHVCVHNINCVHTTTYYTMYIQCMYIRTLPLSIMCTCYMYM